MNVVVVGLIGHDGSGKTTLFQSLANAAGAAPRAVQVQAMSANVADLRMPTRVCQIVDFPNAEVEHFLLGASPFAGAVLVVSAVDGLMPGHRKSLERARQLGVPLAAIALTKGDVVSDEELLDLVEMEARELANKYGYAGDAVPVVRTAFAESPLREGREPEPRAPMGPGALLAVLAR